MLEAGFWGLVAGAALVLGAVVALRAPVSQRTIALVMAFGSGVLISALTFELTEEAYRRAGADAAALGLAAGSIVFFLGDRAIDRRGGEHRKRSGEQMADGRAAAIVLGTLLDGIPESIAIGVSLLEGKGVGVAVVVAVFLSNLPESISASTGMRTAGHSARSIITLWVAVALLSAIAAGLGYAILGGASGDAIAAIQAFAAGAILTMLADTMMPGAYEEGGSVVGLATVLGFSAAFILSTLD